MQKLSVLVSKRKAINLVSETNLTNYTLSDKKVVNIDGCSKISDGKLN
jgi:hypothetical protein